MTEREWIGYGSWYVRNPDFFGIQSGWLTNSITIVDWDLATRILS